MFYNVRLGVAYWVLAMCVTFSSVSAARNAEPGHDHAAEEDAAPASTTHRDELGAGGHDKQGVDAAVADKDGHDEAASNRVELDAARQRAAGVVVTTLTPQALATIVEAPGEVQFHAYRSSKVTTRVAAQIVKRLVREGDSVRTGQPVVRLSSVEVAQAQGERLLAAREWARIKALGKDVASQRRYVEASVAYQQSGARLRAFGLSTEQIDALERDEAAALSTGVFDLIASQNGTIVADDFVDGEFVEPGRVLFEVVDESQMWIESRVPPAVASMLRVGDTATIVAHKDERILGKIVQIAHRIDEQTRLLTVRIEVENPGDRLHPGEFVTAVFADKRTEDALALPQEAVVRTADGDWAVFVVTAPDVFTQTEVKVRRNVGKLVVIDGLQAGKQVVTAGAFFLASELAKGGFDPHNH